MPQSRKRYPQLARPGDPLVLPTGEALSPILPRSAVALAKLPPPIGEARSTTVDGKINPSAFRGTKKRNLKDLPAPPQIMNGIAAVYLYTFMGIGDREIADLLHITTMQLEEIRAHGAYQEFFQVVFDELINVNSDHLQSRIAAFAPAAVSNIMEVASADMEKVKPETILRANQDLADRAGVGAKELAAKKATSNSTLRIVVYDEETQAPSVSIDLNH